MICFVPRKRNLMALFGIGFLIGVVLEIALIEKQRLTNLKLPFKFEDIDGVRVVCVVLLKESTPDNLTAGRNTWMDKCDEILAVRVIRRRKGEAGGGTGSRATAGGRSRLPDGKCAKETGKEAGFRRKTGKNQVIDITGDSAWGGLCKILRLAKECDCQWLLLAPDNLLVVMENLKRFVGNLNWDKEHYFGHAVGHFEADYNALSAGILISRGTLMKLVNKFQSEEDCDSSGKYWRNEDVYLGKYLKEMGIYPKDTRDAEGRGRFHGYNLNVLLHPGKLLKKSDYTRKALFPVPEGFNCCSPDLITIDATDSDRMYHHYFYIYKLDFKHNNTQKLADITGNVRQDGFDWREFLRKEGYSEEAIENVTAEDYYKIWARKISPEALYEKMRRDFGATDAATRH